MRLLARKASDAARRAWFAVNRSTFRDTDPNRRPRLLVDISVIMRHDAGTGIQRVVRGIWQGLRDLQMPDVELVPVHAGRSHGYCFAPHDFLETQGQPGRIPVGVREGDRFLALDLAAHYLPGCAEQLRAWRSAGATTHFVLYDLLPLEHPEWFNRQSKDHFERWFATMLDNADQVLCISDDVKARLLQRLTTSGRTPHPAVGRLHLSGDIGASQLPVRSAPASLGEDLTGRPFLLMVGTVEPRKAHDVALAAMELLWREQPDQTPALVIAGRPGWKTEELQERIRSHSELGTRLHWLQEVSDEQLATLYDAASAVLFPSRAEGFGLPISEAALHRRWVLARDLAVFREQKLPNLLFFHDERPPALARSILDLVATAANGEPAPVEGRSWTDCAALLLAEIGSCAEHVNRPPAQLSQAN